MLTTQQLTGFFSEKQAEAIIKKLAGETLDSTKRVHFYIAKKKYLEAKPVFKIKELEKVFG